MHVCSLDCQRYTKTGTWFKALYFNGILMSKSIKFKGTTKLSKYNRESIPSGRGSPNTPAGSLPTLRCVHAEDGLLRSYSVNNLSFRAFNSFTLLSEILDSQGDGFQCESRPGEKAEPYFWL